MQPIYRYFCGEGEQFDFSEQSAIEQYLYETKGIGDLKINLFNGKKLNGYSIGKHWMDVTVKMWKEDLKTGLLFKSELYNDPDFKEFHWWLDKVISG